LKSYELETAFIRGVLGENCQHREKVWFDNPCSGSDCGARRDLLKWSSVNFWKGRCWNDRQDSPRTIHLWTTSSHKKKYGVEISVERKICQRLHFTSLNWSQSRLKQLEK